MTESGTSCRPDHAVNIGNDSESLPSPEIAEERQADLQVMSEEQRRFAAQNHNMIYTFLHERRMDVDEFYDIAAFGYLKAVMRYCSDQHLHLYAFSTIAWRTMEQSISSFQRSECRRRQLEEEYCEQRNAATYDAFTESEAKLLLWDLVSKTGDLQRKLVLMRLQGYSIAETAAAQGMSPRQVRRLLKEMYRVYLQLYAD